MKVALLTACLLIIGAEAHAKEFRAAWVATVWNIDWPSKPGLSPATQKKELIRILDRAESIGLNAIIFQVRPSGDAFYRSPFEPWSAFLTGTMGRAPEPLYDPLEFAVSEGKKRGLEIHAWINPFRVQSGSFRFASNHISRTRPEWVRKAGKQLWLDPGIPEVRSHVLKIVEDLIRRYDIAGIHIDDYFYPYPPTNLRPKRQVFDDGSSFKKYRTGGGSLGRNDWRRDNINRFVEGLYKTVKAADPDAKLGISPFGIWRPGYPPSIKADLDAYEHLCADSLTWLRNGWCDYFSPQLYWPIDKPDQSFPVLLKWWNEQKPEGVELWPGIASARIGPKRSASEIARQINITRNMLERPGHIHWSMTPLMENRRGITDLLKADIY